jgi:hypothetical protein
MAPPKGADFLLFLELYTKRSKYVQVGGIYQKGTFRLFEGKMSDFTVF